MSHPILYAERKAAGTFTMYLQRPGGDRQRLTAGIPTADEARRRMKVWADLCGYGVKRVNEEEA